MNHTTRETKKNLLELWEVVSCSLTLSYCANICVKIQSLSDRKNLLNEKIIKIFIEILM